MTCESPKKDWASVTYGGPNPRVIRPLVRINGMAEDMPVGYKFDRCLMPDTILKIDPCALTLQVNDALVSYADMFTCAPILIPQLSSVASSVASLSTSTSTGLSTVDSSVASLSTSTSTSLSTTNSAIASLSTIAGGSAGALPWARISVPGQDSGILRPQPVGGMWRISGLTLQSSNGLTPVISARPNGIGGDMFSLPPGMYQFSYRFRYDCQPVATDNESIYLIVNVRSLSGASDQGCLYRIDQELGKVVIPPQLIINQSALVQCPSGIDAGGVESVGTDKFGVEIRGPSAQGSNNLQTLMGWAPFTIDILRVGSLP